MRHNHRQHGRKRPSGHWPAAILFFACAVAPGVLHSQTRPSDEISSEWLKVIQGKDSSQKAPAGEEKAGALDALQDEQGRGFFGPAETESAPSFVSVFVRFVLLLGAMTLGLYYLARYIKKRQGIPAGHGNNLIKVIVTQPLMNGKYLQIVDLAGQLLVLGVSENGVTLVKHIEDGPTADRITIWKESQDETPVPEFHFLKKLFLSVTGRDFRFWNHEEESPAAVRNKISFRRLMEEAADPPSGRKSRPAQEDQDLSELLSVQKKRLAALKKRGSLKEQESNDI